MAAVAPAAPLNIATAGSGSIAGGGKKLIVLRKDCVLEYHSQQERYVLKHATCDRMIVSLVDRFWEVEKDPALRKDKKGKKAKIAEVVETARLFCIGSLKVLQFKNYSCFVFIFVFVFFCLFFFFKKIVFMKLWSAGEVLNAMLRLMNDLIAHANKMQGTDWAVTSDLGCLERLVRVWLQECFPQCVQDSDTLQSFTALVSAMPDRDAIEADIVQLAQKKSALFKRTVGKKSALKKRTLGLFVPAPRPVPTDFMQVDVLDIPAAEMAQELTRITLGLFREISVHKLVKRDLSMNPLLVKSAADLPPLFVLRARTERLSNWTASVVVGEKLLKRRVALFSKMVAIAAKLADARNLHDAVAMVTALHNPAVSRLRQTNAAAGETVNTAFQVAKRKTKVF
jgi:hypothetical protein